MAFRYIEGWHTCTEVSEGRSQASREYQQRRRETSLRIVQSLKVVKDCEITLELGVRPRPGEKEEPAKTEEEVVDESDGDPAKFFRIFARRRLPHSSPPEHRLRCRGEQIFTNQPRSVWHEYRSPCSNLPFLCSHATW